MTTPAWAESPCPQLRGGRRSERATTMMSAVDRMPPDEDDLTSAPTRPSLALAETHVAGVPRHASGRSPASFPELAVTLSIAAAAAVATGLARGAPTGIAPLDTAFKVLLALVCVAAGRRAPWPFLAAAGAENVEYPLKTACCGGAHTLSDSDTSTKLVLNLLTTAEACGADVIATECPTCHTGLEIHQVRAEKVLGRKTSVKILYFTQLLGMALGLSARKVGVHENFSDSSAFLRTRGLG